jgi:hypothetical protein
MDNTQSAVAVIRVVDYEAKTKNVHDLIERLLLGPHLFVDGVDVFLSTYHFGAYSFSVESR